MIKRINKTKVDKVSNKSSKYLKSTVKQKSLVKTIVVKKSIQKVKKPKEELFKTVIINKVECINEGGNYLNLSMVKKESHLRKHPMAK